MVLDWLPPLEESKTPPWRPKTQSRVSWGREWGGAGCLIGRLLPRRLLQRSCRNLVKSSLMHTTTERSTRNSTFFATLR